MNPLVKICPSRALISRTDLLPIIRPGGGGDGVEGFRTKRVRQLERPHNPSLANYSILLKLAAADVALTLPGASCLDH